MARGLNKVQIIGNLGADPEMRYTPSGTAVTNFNVAVSRRVRGQDGNFTDETEWFRVNAWEKLAETCSQFLHKGSKVYIEGRLRSRKYMDKDNIERTSVEIVANEMLMLDGRAEGAEMGQGGARPAMRESAPDNRPPARSAAPSGGRAPQRPSRDEYDDSDLDDVPF